VREHSGILSDGVQVVSLLQCPHCGGHFESMPGSGKRRTFCLKCSAVTCGNPACDPCVPFEARLEHAEGAKTRYDSVIRQMTSEGAILL
jgi:hypothetical protein